MHLDRPRVALRDASVHRWLEAKLCLYLLWDCYMQQLRSLLSLLFDPFHSLQYLVREHMVEEGMTHHLKSMGNSIIR